MTNRGPYRVPSTSVLIAFESAARQGSFTLAAHELHTSQSAVSRHIANLEKQLSARLFERTRIGVGLTEAGSRYREAVLIGLEAIHDVAAEVATQSDVGTPEVKIACPDEVAHLFVMQRFDALRAALGEEVRICVLAYTGATAPLSSEPSADVILTWDAENSAPRQRVTIAREAVGAFCSPGYAAAHANVLNGPVAGWGGLTVLEIGGSDEDGASWAHWFAAVGHPSSEPRREVVGSHAHALEEAVAGHGLVLGWRHLIGRHVEAGTLVMQGGEFVETGGFFHAVRTEKGREQPMARSCLAFFAGASKHRAGGWDEP